MWVVGGAAAAAAAALMSTALARAHTLNYSLESACGWVFPLSLSATIVLTNKSRDAGECWGVAFAVAGAVFERARRPGVRFFSPAHTNSTRTHTQTDFIRLYAARKTL